MGMWIFVNLFHHSLHPDRESGRPSVMTMLLMMVIREVMGMGMATEMVMVMGIKEALNQLLEVRQTAGALPRHVCFSRHTNAFAHYLKIKLQDRQLPQRLQWSLHQTA
jgi:hypothetical protein